MTCLVRRLQQDCARELGRDRRERFVRISRGASRRRGQSSSSRSLPASRRESRPRCVRSEQSAGRRPDEDDIVGDRRAIETVDSEADPAQLQRLCGRPSTGVSAVSSTRSFRGNLGRRSRMVSTAPGRPRQRRPASRHGTEGSHARARALARQQQRYGSAHRATRSRSSRAPSATCSVAARSPRAFRWCRNDVEAQSARQPTRQAPTTSSSRIRPFWLVTSMTRDPANRPKLRVAAARAAERDAQRHPAYGGSNQVDVSPRPSAGGGRAARTTKKMAFG